MRSATNACLLPGVRCELPCRPLDSQGREQPVRATYIGYCNGEAEDQYQIFVKVRRASVLRAQR